MSWWIIVGIAFGLSMDAVAVSVATGLCLAKITGRHVFRLAFHFGLFQCLMPIAGYLAGRFIADIIASYDHWIAFGLLAFVGGKMLVESFGIKEKDLCADPSRGWSLLTLSIATSIDALAVGLSFAFLGVSVYGPAMVIGVITAVLSALGVLFGARLGQRFGAWADFLGGVVLIAIGVRILVSHLAGG